VSSLSVAVVSGFGISAPDIHIISDTDIFVKGILKKSKKTANLWYNMINKLHPNSKRPHYMNERRGEDARNE